MFEIEKKALLLQKLGRRLFLFGHSREGFDELREGGEVGSIVRRGILQLVGDSVHAVVVHISSDEHRPGDSY